MGQSLSGSATGHQAQAGTEALAPGTRAHRLEVPCYYAANAQILLSDNDVMLLFTRPHPAILPDGHVAPAPLQQPVALIQMSFLGLKNLSRTMVDMVRQAESKGGEPVATANASGNQKLIRKQR